MLKLGKSVVTAVTASGSGTTMTTKVCAKHIVILTNTTSDMSNVTKVGADTGGRKGEQMSLINREVLYEKACDLEAQALAYVGKIVNDETKIEEWKIWSAILVERTAFKHDVYDAPTIEPERKTGWWLIREGISDAQCSECKMYFRDVYDMDNSDAFCRHCGTKMEGLKVVKE